MKKNPITVIILTYNEELNLRKCLESVFGWTEEIIVVDSGSTDRTTAIAEEFGARVLRHPFTNQSEQFNWALDNAAVKSDWVLKLDADEYILPGLRDEIIETLPKTPPDVTGYYIKRRVFFLGRWIRHGGYYPTWFLRLWRNGTARMEPREVDEHALLLEGRAGKLKNDFVDENKNNLAWWTAKINNHTNREVQARIREKSKLAKHSLFKSQAERKKWLRYKIYYRLPRFVRPFLYFVYRYFFRFGFLDGKEGLIFHFLQGCWNQFLVDAKMYEYEKQAKNKKLAARSKQ